MKKLIAFATSPWPLLLLIALGMLVFLTTSLGWIYSQSASEKAMPPASNSQEIQP